MDCRDIEDRIHAYLEEEVTTREDGLIRAHLALCGKCRAHAEGLERQALSIFPLVPEATASRVEREVLEALRKRPVLRRPAVAIGLIALVVVFLVAGYLLWGGGPSPRRGGPRPGPGGEGGTPFDREGRGDTEGPVDGGLPAGATIEIRGRVADMQDRPIDGASVRVSFLEGDPAPAGWNTTTDPEGRFRIARVNRGILMQVSKRGHVPQYLALPEIPSWIEEGRLHHDVSLVIARAGAVAGTVLDEAGLPIGGVRVLFRVDEGRPLTFLRTIPRVDEEVVSATDGSYRLETVPLSKAVRVLWVHEEYALAMSDPLWLGGTAQEGRKDIVLAPGGSVEGTVVDFRQQPRSGADVRVLPTSSGEAPPIWDRTGVDGRFRIRYLPLGEWELRVGFGTLELWQGRFTLTPEARKAEVRVELEKEGREAPTRSGAVRGRAVALESGEPVPGLEVRVRGDGISRSEVAAPSGDFRVQGPPGTWTVAVSAPGRSILLWEGVRVSTGGETDLGEVYLPLEATIEGRIEGPDGAGVTGAEIRVLDLSGQPVPVKGKERWESPPRIRSDGDGGFFAGGLAREEYWVVVVHPEFAPNARDVRAAEGGEGIVLVLEAPPPLTVEFEGPGGEPAVPELFQVFLPQGPLLWETRPAETAVSVLLAPGTYEAVVRGPDESEERYTLTPTGEEEAEPIRLRVP